MDKDVTLCLYTYSPSVDHPRHRYAKTTLSSCLSNIRDSKDLQIHIADDGSDPKHVAALVKLAKSWGHDPTISNSERAGYGRNYNLASQVINSRSNYVLDVEDDWQLMKPLDLTSLITAMEGYPYGCMRLGYLGFYPPPFRLVTEFVHMADQNFLHFLPEFTTDPFIFTGHPRLTKVSWREKLGAWPEGLGPGETEMAVCGRPASAEGVLWPLDLCQTWGSLFSHIGSVQAR